MSMTFRSTFRGLLKASAACGVLASATMAHSAEVASAAANDASDHLDEVVVTGTNIRGRAPIGAAVIQIDREDLERGGFTDPGQLLRSLPANFGGGVNAETFVSGGNLDSAASNRSFVAGANLLGLGSGATLTLLNGRRLPPAAEGIAADMSVIPAAVISRIDVLVDGASAIYGADAVAGVVNIMTRRQFEGVEIRARYGAADGGLETSGGSVMAGGQVGRLSGLVAVDYLDQNSLSASKRLRSEAMPRPTTVVGATERTSLFGSGEYILAPQIKLYADVGYMSRLGDSVTSSTSAIMNRYVRMFQYLASGGTVIDVGSGWTIDAGGSYSSNKTKAPIYNTTRASGRVAATFSNSLSELKSVDARASGPLFHLPAGNVDTSVGVGYRDETFSSPTSIRRNTSRNVKSVYGEVNVPLLGTEAAIPWVHELRLSLAGRRDDYSDFGAVSVPKVGLSWSPDPTVTFHATFSKSFRAPSPFEKSSAYSVGPTFVTDTGGQTIKALYISAGQGPDLTPERSDNYNLGLAFTPDWLPGLKLTVDGYRITYKDRIALPDPTFAYAVDIRNAPAQLLTRNPSPAQIAALVAGANFVDESLFPLATSAVIIDGRSTNIANTKLQGVQIGAVYNRDIGDANLELTASLNYIDKYTYQLSPGAPTTQRVDRMFSPTDLRSRVGARWTRGPLSTSLTWNYVDGYTDDRVSSQVASVKAWSTLDASASYDLKNVWGAIGNGARVIVSVTNLFNADPPFVAATSSTFRGEWDGSNASIVGRFASVEIVKAF